MKIYSKYTKFLGLRKIDLLYLLIFTILVIILHGYSYGTGDQVLYIVLLNKLRDASLFPTDYLFPVFYSHQTLMYDGIAMIGRILEGNFFLPYTILYIIATFFWYTGIYKLTLTLFPNPKIALLSSLLFIFPYPVGGAAVTTVEVSFLLRLITNVLLIYLLTSFLERKYLIVLYLFVLICLIHPLSGLIFSPLVIFALYKASAKERSQVFIQGLLLMSIVGPFLILKSKPQLIASLPLMPSPEWLEIIKARNRYAFPVAWTIEEWTFLILALVPLIIYIARGFFRRQLSDKKMQLFVFILGIASCLLILQIIFTNFFPMSYVIFMQLGRIWLLPITLSFILAADLSVQLFDRYIPKSVYLKTIIVIGLILAILVRNKASIMLQPSQWQEAQMWVKKHTSVNCTVLTNFYSQGFRVYSERSIVGEYKDGTLSFYSPVFAKTWYDKKELLSREDWYREQVLETIQFAYPFSLVVLLRGQITSLPIIFSNRDYNIYRMPKTEPNCSIFL